MYTYEIAWDFHQFTCYTPPHPKDRGFLLIYDQLCFS